MDSFFNDLVENQEIKGNDDSSNMKNDVDSKMTYIDRSTLSQIILFNEKYQKRELPKNDENKPIFEIIKGKSTLSKEDLVKLIDQDIINIEKKNWNVLSCVSKKTIINEYVEQNNFKLSKSLNDLIRHLSTNKNDIKYDKKTQKIIWMSDKLFSSNGN